MITAGTAVREAIKLIQDANAEVAGIVVALDRQEKGQHHTSAIQEISELYPIPVVSIIKLDDIITYLADKPEYAQLADKIKHYRELYGV